jgi:hypothetical protein
MLSRPQSHSAAGRIRSDEKISDLIRHRTRDLLACSIMCQPTTPLRAPCFRGVKCRKCGFSGRILFHAVNKFVARVSFRARHVEFAAHKATPERFFSKCFDFPLPVNILPFVPQHQATHLTPPQNYVKIRNFWCVRSGNVWMYSLHEINEAEMGWGLSISLLLGISLVRPPHEFARQLMLTLENTGWASRKPHPFAT